MGPHPRSLPLLIPSSLPVVRLAWQLCYIHGPVINQIQTTEFSRPIALSMTFADLPLHFPHSSSCPPPPSVSHICLLIIITSIPVRMAQILQLVHYYCSSPTGSERTKISFYQPHYLQFRRMAATEVHHRVILLAQLLLKLI